MYLVIGRRSNRRLSRRGLCDARSYLIHESYHAARRRNAAVYIVALFTRAPLRNYIDLLCYLQILYVIALSCVLCNVYSTNRRITFNLE